MAHVLLLHSVLGLRPAVLAAADRLRDAGHVVVTPDLYAGAVADNLGDGSAIRDRITVDVLMARAGEALGDLPSGGVLSGMSMGAWIANDLGVADPRVGGLLLLHGVGAPPEKVAPGLRAQAHVARDDEFATDEEVQAWAQGMLRLGGEAEVFHYTGGHLFTDADLGDYNGASADLTWERSLRFLDGLSRTPS